MLAAQIARLPPENVAEENRRLVVEVVAGGDDVVSVLDGDRVEQVPFRQTTRAARGSVRRRRGAWDVVTEVGGEVDLVQLEPSILRESARGVSRGLGVFADPEPQIQPIGAIAEVDEQVPEGERVLPA